MKVALCFSGLPRFWKIGYKYHYKNLISVYNPDIFIHTWYDSHILEHDPVFDTYKPIRASVTPNNKLILKQEYPRGTSERYRAYNIFSFYKSMQECNDLKCDYENAFQFKYDWVFRLRFDYALNRTFDLEKLDPNLIHFPRDLEDRGMVTDQFAFSSSHNMDIYSSVYDYLHDYYEAGEDMVGEHMLIHHLKEKNIYDKKMYHDMNHPYNPGSTGSLDNSLIRDSVSYKDYNTKKFEER